MSSSIPKANSHDNKTNGSANGHALQPLDNVFTPAPETGALLEMQTGLFELGRNRAALSGAVTADPETVRSLEEHARSIARDTHREDFDPRKNAHDRMHQAEYERLLAEREEIGKGVAHATANLRESEMALASTAKAGPKPQANVWLAGAFIVASAVTIAPTLHDFVFFGVPDDVLAWFGSALCAAFVAAMLTVAILSGQRTRWEWFGVVAGVGVGLGLMALRLSSAHGVSQGLFAVGLTAVEVSAVMLLEWLARGLRAREDEWRALRPLEEKAIALRDSALADLERRKAHAQEVGGAIGNKIAYVEDRSHRCVHLPELEAVAIKAVLDGYNAGIAENLGRLRGARGII